MEVRMNIFFQGLAIKLRFAVNWPNPWGLPQTACVMTGKKRRDINKPTSGFGAGIIILRIHPRCIEKGISEMLLTLITGGRVRF